MPVQEALVITDNGLPVLHTTPISTPIETSDYLPYLLPAFYLIVSSFLLYRFIFNLSKLLSKIKGNKTVNYSGAKLVLTNNNAIPFSFMNYIFVNKEKFEKGTIEKEVLQHELTHVKQMHSLDVILVELIISIAWFNPLLFLFRRSILLNHEFLADDSVVATFNDAKAYQLLLFEKANRKNNLILTSSFNYLITKKRLIMMTRKTSQKVAIVKQIAIIPLIAALGFLFSTKVVAQDNSTPLKQKQVQESIVDASQKFVDEYKAKLEQYGLTNKEGNRIKGHKDLTADENNELGDLFMKMSKEQRWQQTIVFMPALKGTLPKTIPMKAQFEMWKNPKIYGLWINDKKVENSALNNYSNTDFEQAFVSSLAGNARKNVNYQVQVNLMTKDYYQKYRSETLTRQKNDRNKYKMGYSLKRSVDNKIDSKKDSQLLLDQKVKLDKEQQALLLDQQKKELDNNQDSKSLSEQQVLLREQRLKLNNAIISKYEKVKMEKEMQTMTKEQKVKMKDEEAKIMEQKVKMEKDMEAQMKDQKVMMKDQQAKMMEQKVKMEKEMQSKMIKQEVTMKEQEAKINELKAKLEAEQKVKQEQK